MSNITISHSCLTLPLSVLLYWGPVPHISFLQIFGLLWGPEACADTASQPPAVKKMKTILHIIKSSKLE